MKRHLSTFVAGLLLGTALIGAVPAARSAEDPRARLQQPAHDDVIYFLMLDRFENGDPSNDTGGIAGDAKDHGFDPTNVDFFHGGDLKGLTARLDYIAGLGATAIWVSPVFKNDPTQFRNGRHTAGYHGYWINDFTDVDPHFGTRADFAAFVEAAHARGLKVILDIVINHTSDVVKLRECHDPAVAGAGANEGSDCPYRPLSGPAYTPYIPAGDAGVKAPAWLNDVRNYRNRGESTFKGESSIYGDFAGLDDVATERPEVVQGFIDVYRQWITDFRIDGYRIDTARHVETPFWQAFIPAILDHAREQGIPNFQIFGESLLYEPEELARFTRDDRFPAVLDFAFQGAAAAAASGRLPPEALARIFAKDTLYAEGAETARRLPTFLGNHDIGRYGWFLSKDRPGIGEAERLQRATLAHALMFFSRGVPVIYYGDEQGFAGEGGYGASRASMFPSKVAAYNADDLIGTDANTSVSSFNTGHPLYKAIAQMAGIRAAEPALRGAGQRVLRADTSAGILAMLRSTPGAPDVLVIANTATSEMAVDLEIGAGRLTALMGTCPTQVGPSGRLQAKVPGLTTLVCRVER